MTLHDSGSFHHETVSCGDEVDRRAWSAGVGAEGSSDVGVALATEEGEDEVAGGSHDLGCSPRADGRAILVEGDVPDVMDTIFDPPVAANEREQARGVGALRWQAGDVVGDLDTRRAGRDPLSEGDAMPFQATDLVDVGPGGVMDAGAAEPAQDARMLDRPEHPQFASPMPDLRIGLEDDGDPATLVTQPAWRDRDAVAVAAGFEPWGKTLPRSPRAGWVGWHRPARRSRQHAPRSARSERVGSRGRHP